MIFQTFVIMNVGQQGVGVNFRHRIGKDQRNIFC